MRIFVKRECLLAAKTAYQLITLNVSKKDNLVAPEKIKLTTATNDLVMSQGESGCLQSVLCANLNQHHFKTPGTLPFSVIRNSSCLSPNNMAREQGSSILKFEYVVDKLFQSKYFSAKEADATKYQYDNF